MASRKLTLRGLLERAEHAPAPRKVEQYMFSLHGQSGDDGMVLAESKPAITLRLTRATTNVQERGQVEITALDAVRVVDGAEVGPPVPLLLRPIDAYEWTWSRTLELRAAFCRAHGITEDQLEVFCDAHDLYPTDPTTFVRGTIWEGQHTLVRMRARDHKLPKGFMFVLCFVGEGARS